MSAVVYSRQKFPFAYYSQPLLFNLHFRLQMSISPLTNIHCDYLHTFGTKMRDKWYSANPFCSSSPRSKTHAFPFRRVYSDDHTVVNTEMSKSFLCCPNQIGPTSSGYFQIESCVGIELLAVAVAVAMAVVVMVTVLCDDLPRTKACNNVKKTHPPNNERTTNINETVNWLFEMSL